MTTLLFAIQWVVGGGRPLLYHVVSVVLLAITSVLVYRVASRCVTPAAAVLAAALFAVHPVHVEAVGNIVGQAELVVGLACVAALLLYLRARERGRVDAGTVAGIVVLYAVACLTKDNGIVLPGLLLAAELTIVRDATLRAQRVRTLLPLALALVVVAAGYLVARTLVVGGVGGGPHPAFTHVPGVSRTLTMLGVLPQWLRLLFWPARLSADYSPAEIAVRTGFDVALLPALAILLGMGGLLVLAARRSRALVFGACWIAVAIFPVSNLLLPTGVLLAERTLYLASVGAAIVVAILVEWLARRGAESAAPRWLVPAVASLLVVIAAARSALRYPAWRDTDTIFAQTVVDAPLSFRAHWAYGGSLFARGDAAGGEREFRIAMRLFPYEPELFYELGDSYRNAKMCPPAMPLLERTLALSPDHSNARIDLILCLLEQKRFSDAGAQARLGLRHSPKEALPSFERLLGYAERMLAARDSLPARPPVIGAAN